MNEYTPTVHAKIFDATNPNWEQTKDYNLMFLRAQQNYLNDLLKRRGHVFLNEVYDALGFRRTPSGQLLGWLNAEDAEIRFDIRPHRDAHGERDNEFVMEFNIHGIIFEQI